MVYYVCMVNVMYTICMQYLQQPEEGTRYPGLGLQRVERHHRVLRIQTWILLML